jgi:hypothetical protein
VTLDWLEAHRIPFDELWMWDPAKHGFFEHKEQAVARLLTLYDVQLAIDDSKTHAEMYRAAGIPTIEVPGGVT